MPLTDVGGVPVVHTGGGLDGGGGWLGMLLLIALLGGGRGLFGGRDGREVHGEFRHAETNNRFNEVNANLNRVEQSGFNRDMYKEAEWTRAEIGKLGYSQALIAKDAEIRALECCCKTNQNILENKYALTQEIVANRSQAEKDTCAIITNQNALAKDAELRLAYAKIAEQTTALSEQRVISTILQNLQPPRPVPAFAAANPYESYVAPVRVVQPHCHSHFNNC
jgi:hypothetical protein